MRTRTAKLHEAPQIAELDAQLGYPITPAEMRWRLEAILRNEDHHVLVAEGQQKQIVRWLRAMVSRPLVAEPTSNISGLVVDQQFRRYGVVAP